MSDINRYTMDIGDHGSVIIAADQVGNETKLPSGTGVEWVLASDHDAEVERLIKSNYIESN